VRVTRAGPGALSGRPVRENPARTRGVDILNTGSSQDRPAGARDRTPNRNRNRNPNRSQSEGQDSNEETGREHDYDQDYE